MVNDFKKVYLTRLIFFRIVLTKGIVKKRKIKKSWTNLEISFRNTILTLHINSTKGILKNIRFRRQWGRLTVSIKMKKSLSIKRICEKMVRGLMNFI